MGNKYKYIPFGIRCSTAGVLADYLKKREASLPFDWIDVPLKGIINFIPPDGNDLEDFVTDYLKKVTQQRHPVDQSYFPHDFITGTAEEFEIIRQKYIRRFYRLFEYLQTGDWDIVLITTIVFPDEDNIRYYREAVEKMASLTTKKIHRIVINLTTTEYDSPEINLCIPFPNEWTLFHEQIGAKLLSSELTKDFFAPDI